MERIQKPVLESTLEFDKQMLTEIDTRRNQRSNSDYTMVADSNLVPDDSIISSSTTDTNTDFFDTSTNTNRHLANKKRDLETRRVEIISAKYNSSNLNNATNRSYKPGQLLFLQWASEHQVSQTEFSATDLINFLSDMFSLKDYAIGTIKLFRTAVTHLSKDPKPLREDKHINDFITTFLNQAPPVLIHRVTIDLQPTFKYLKQISSTETSLAKLQSKLAFLLTVTCFLRPSDLSRIPLSSIKIKDNLSSLSFEVHCPKEKRARRKIIKSFEVKAHTKPQIRPVNTCNIFLQKRPSCSVTSCFVNSLQQNKPLSVRTLQSWLSHLLRKSKAEKQVSIRSIASSLALKSGIPKEDIVTLGNWASSSTFENHYRREHLSNFDFTNTLITTVNLNSEEDEEQFFDAEDNLN